MQTTQRCIDPGLIEQLRTRPWSFEFCQAVRVLESCFDRSARAPSTLPAQLVFRNPLVLGFAPSQLESVSLLQTSGAVEEGSPGLERVELTPSFIGLLGSMGALPVHYTEHVIEHERVRRDPAPRAFLDLFANRAIAQFYLAWRKYKPALQYESDRTRHFVPQVLALCGLGGVGMRERMKDMPGPVEDEALAHFAGLLRQRPVSAHSLERVLSGYFRVPVVLEQFVGRWYSLPAEQRSTLGCRNVELGRHALAGERVWQRDLRVRIRVGPLSARQYQSFLPGNAEHAALGRMLGVLSGAAFEYELCPILRAADVQDIQLEARTGSRLGFDTFLCSRAATTARNDAAFEIRPSC